MLLTTVGGREGKVWRERERESIAKTGTQKSQNGIIVREGSLWMGAGGVEKFRKKTEDVCATTYLALLILIVGRLLLGVLISSFRVLVLLSNVGGRGQLYVNAS